MLGRNGPCGVTERRETTGTNDDFRQPNRQLSRADLRPHAPARSSLSPSPDTIHFLDRLHPVFNRIFTYDNRYNAQGGVRNLGRGEKMSTARRVRWSEFASRWLSRLLVGRRISTAPPALSTRRVSPPVSDDFRQRDSRPSRKAALSLLSLRPWSPVLFFFVLATLHLSLATASFAQVGDATLSGVISDPKGAVVPDTEVTITRIETGTILTTRTNGAGVYVFTALQQGHYHLVLNKPGFKEIAIKDFELHTQDNLERNFSLEIGSQSESVTVNASTSNESPR